MHIIKWKESIWKGCILYNFQYVMFWKRKHHGDIEKIIGCQVFKGPLWIKKKKKKKNMDVPLVSDVDSGRAYTYLDRDVSGTLNFSLQFCSESEIVLKHKTVL